jgi:hypothetical protein
VCCGGITRKCSARWPLAEASLRGQPHKATIASALFKDKIEQLKA